MELALPSTGRDRKNENIQHLRGIAILWVLCHHFVWLQPLLPTILWEAWSGVDLFFAISGYVVSVSLARTLVLPGANSSLRQKLSVNARAIEAFLTRRFWRIVPPLVAALTILALLTLFCGVARWRSVLVEIAAALSMSYNYVLYGGGPFTLDVLWSLAVEMQFYLLLPLFLLAFFTRQQRLAAASAVYVLVGLVVRPLHVHFLTISSQNWLAVRDTTHCRLDSLAAGVFVFALLCDERLVGKIRRLSMFTIRLVAFFCIAILMLIPAATSIEFSHTVGFSLLAAASAVLVMLSAALPVDILPTALARRVLRYIGERSFSLYLLHRLAPAAFASAFPAIVRGAQATSNAGFRLWILECAAIVATTFAAAELMYRFVELPSIKAGEKFGRRILGVAEAPDACPSTRPIGQ